MLRRAVRATRAPTSIDASGSPSETAAGGRSQRSARTYSMAPPFG